MKSNKKNVYLILFVVILLIVFGVSFAFFNYTRTGSLNMVRTGNLVFNSEQGTSINLTNVFPVDVSQGISNNNPNVGSVTINVSGETNYEKGVEYLVSVDNINNTIGTGNNLKMIPISVSVSVEENTIGIEDGGYYSHRGTSVESSIYKLFPSDTISTGDQLLVGYIKSGSTGVDGNIIITAYIDANKVVISDTYPEELTDENNDGYLDGTTDAIVDGRTVLTTSEWNSLQTNGISFQVKVEANEGTWVTPTIDSCPGCKFIYTLNTYYYSGANQSTVNDFATNNETLVDDYTLLNKNHFLGVIVDNNTITRAFACGIKGADVDTDTLEVIVDPGVNDGTPFCIEGTTDGSKHRQNIDLITGPTLWNNPNLASKSCYANGTYYVWCESSTLAVTIRTGVVFTEPTNTYDDCFVGNDGMLVCEE